MKPALPLLLLLLLPGLFWYSCRSAPPSAIVEEYTDDDDEYADYPESELPPIGEALPVSSFGEVWAYVVAGREAALTKGLPITDIGYFGADVNSYGSLIEVPNRRKLPAFSGRVHLVVKCDGRALTHFVLKPGSAERGALVADLLAAARDFDGLQIDFENVPARDGDAFVSFLAELRSGIGGKMFTVALPARTRRIADDVYDYEKIKPLVDRILVMAYDEHWSGSSPGSIASLAWCRRVATHSLSVIGKEKLIMGLPFYGRAWGRPITSQAYMYSGIERVIKENNVTDIRHETGIPTFDYKVSVSVKVYYEDEYSLSARMEMYRTMGIAAIGFWRLGQETPTVWKLLRVSDN